MSNAIVVGIWSKSQIPNPQPTQKRKGRYIKPAELVAFENEYNAHAYDRMPNFPEYAKVRTRFRDDTANGLTNAILAHLKYTKNFGARVNTTGVYDSRRGQYRATAARKGMADISAIINGKAVQIEVKAGADKPRTSQIKVQSEYRAAGGIYEFVHNFSEYIKLFNKLTNEQK